MNFKKIQGKEKKRLTNVHKTTRIKTSKSPNFKQEKKKNDVYLFIVHILFYLKFVNKIRNVVLYLFEKWLIIVLLFKGFPLVLF